MNLAKVYAHGLGALLSASVVGVGAADAVLCRVSLYRRPRAVVLDTLLGPADDFDYVSTTAPSSPPPTSE